jgi:hypothetical protein
MSANKITVAISPTEEMWNKQDFRDLVKQMVEDVEGTTLYVVTTNTNDEFISDFISESGIEASDVFQVIDDTALVAKLIELDVRLFLSDDQKLNTYVNLNDELILIENQVSGCQSILVNNILDQNKVQMKYITYLDFWTKQINRYN